MPSSYCCSGGITLAGKDGTGGNSMAYTERTAPWRLSGNENMPTTCGITPRPSIDDVKSHPLTAAERTAAIVVGVFRDERA